MDIRERLKLEEMMTNVDFGPMAELNYKMFKAHIDAGFTEEQAMTVVTNTISAIFAFGKASGEIE